MRLSKKAKQQLLDHPESGPRDKKGVSNPLTVYIPSDLRGVVVAPAGVEPDGLDLPSEEAVKEFNRRVVTRCAPPLSEDELNGLDAEIERVAEEGERAAEEFIQFIQAVLTRVTPPIPEEGELIQLDEELAKVQRIGGAR